MIFRTFGKVFGKMPERYYVEAFSAFRALAVSYALDEMILENETEPELRQGIRVQMNNTYDCMVKLQKTAKFQTYKIDDFIEKERTRLNYASWLLANNKRNNL